MAKLRRASGKDMVRFLEREGFRVIRVAGSHHYLMRGHQRTSVPVHGNRALKVGTLRNILRAINMTPEEFQGRYNS